MALVPKGKCDHNTVASIDWLDAVPQRTSKVTGPWKLQPAADMRDMQREGKAGEVAIILHNTRRDRIKYMQIELIAS